MRTTHVMSWRTPKFSRCSSMTISKCWTYLILLFILNDWTFGMLSPVSCIRTVFSVLGCMEADRDPIIFWLSLQSGRYISTSSLRDPFLQVFLWHLQSACLSSLNSVFTVSTSYMLCCSPSIHCSATLHPTTIATSAFTLLSLPILWTLAYRIVPNSKTSNYRTSGALHSPNQRLSRCFSWRYP